MTQKTRFTIFASALRAATHTSIPLFSQDCAGIKLFLDITAVSGNTPTMDIKLQEYDALSGNWKDMPSAAFAQKTTTGQDSLTIYPGIATSANRLLNAHLPKQFRAVSTLAAVDTPNFTYSLGAELIP